MDFKGADRGHDVRVGARVGRLPPRVRGGELSEYSGDGLTLQHCQWPPENTLIFPVAPQPHATERVLEGRFYAAVQ